MKSDASASAKTVIECKVPALCLHHRGKFTMCAGSCPKSGTIRVPGRVNPGLKSRMGGNPSLCQEFQTNYSSTDST